MIAFWVNSICEENYTLTHTGSRHRMKKRTMKWDFCLPVGNACSAFDESVSFHRKQIDADGKCDAKRIIGNCIIVLAIVLMTTSRRHGQSIERTGAFSYLVLQYLRPNDQRGILFNRHENKIANKSRIRCDRLSFADMSVGARIANFIRVLAEIRRD